VRSENKGIFTGLSCDYWCDNLPLKSNQLNYTRAGLLMITCNARLVFVLVASTGLVLSSCSSNTQTTPTSTASDGVVALSNAGVPSDSTDESQAADSDGGLTYSYGAASNTGIAGAPRASKKPLTELRPALIDLDYLTDANGFSTRVTSENNLHGGDLQSLGDVNGDGLADFTFSTKKIISIEYETTIEYKTTIVFGSSGNLSEIDLGNLDSESGFVFDGLHSFHGAGDVNGDGIDDVVSAAFDSHYFSSKGQVIFGRDDGELVKTLREPVVGEDGFNIYNSVNPIRIRILESAGDFNNDGIDDLLIAGYTPSQEDHNGPMAWVVYGNADIGSNENIDLANLPAADGFSLVSPTTNSGLATTLTGGFDFNGDNIGDIAVATDHFDKESNTGEGRVYIVYGAATRSIGTVDMSLLNGEDGVRLVIDEDLHSAYIPDRVRAIGDIDANGFNDLGISVENNSNVLVVFSGKGSQGAVIDSSALPKGYSMLVHDSSLDSASSISSVRIGDIDNDGVDDLGITKPSSATIVFGSADTLPDSLDLAAPMNVELTNIQGMDDKLAFHAVSPLVALGDINNDGADDLGIGWTDQKYRSDIKQIDDINGDGIEDLSIGGTSMHEVSLLRVVYGFPSEGFTGFLSATDNPKPIAIIEKDYFNQVIDSLDTAAKYAINTLNDNARNGVDSGPTAQACLANSVGIETGEIEQFSCDSAPLTFGYEWFGKYGGSGIGRFASVAYTDDVLMDLKFSSYAEAQGAQGPGSGNRFGVFVHYDVNGVVSNRAAADQGITTTGSCTIDATTRITQDDSEACLHFLSGAILNLDALFGENPAVENLTLLP